MRAIYISLTLECTFKKKNQLRVVFISKSGDNSWWLVQILQAYQFLTPLLKMLEKLIRTFINEGSLIHKHAHRIGKSVETTRRNSVVRWRTSWHLENLSRASFLTLNVLLIVFSSIPWCVRYDNEISPGRHSKTRPTGLRIDSPNSRSLLGEPALKRR